MKKTGFGLVKTAVVILIVACANSALADSVSDHFDDGALDPAWNVTFDNALGWTYSEAGTKLTVTDITIDQPWGVESWSDIFISQPFIAAGDFSLEASIYWDSQSSNSAMQGVFVHLKSEAETVVRAGYGDAWVTRRGERSAFIGETKYNSGMNTMPLSGNAIVKVERVGGQIFVFWNNALILNAIENRIIDEVAVEFKKCTYLSATFGELAIDYISANSEIVELLGLEIEGPNEVAEESSAQYSAIAVYDNNSTRDVTSEAYWAVIPDNYADINDSGLLTTDQLVMPTEDVTLYAEYEEGNDIAQAEKDVQILAMCPQGSALEFDGEDDYVNLGTSDSIKPNLPLTLSAWINLSKLGTNNRILALDINIDKYYGVWFKVKTDNTLEISYGDGGGTNSGSRRSKFGMTELDKDIWYHVATVIRGPENINLYIDGKDDGGVYGGSGGPLLYSNGFSSIGYNYAPHTFFYGNIDEVTIFNRGLSGEEIQIVMFYGPDISDSNLVGYWKFDEGSGQIAHNSSGNANVGYLGSDPCELDDSDPCWVEPGAPLHCTPRQMIVRNLDGAIERKRIAQQQINEALERERASIRLLMRNMRGRRHFGWHPWNVMHSVIEIHKSMRMEYLCKKKLHQSVQALERALDWLGNNAVPTWPQKSSEPKPGNPGNRPEK